MKKIVIGLIAMVFGFSGSMKAQQHNGNRQVLDAGQQKIVTIAALTARGELDKLKVQLNEGLDAGLTVNQIKEVLVHLYAYSGFPRSLRGLQTFMAVLDERKAKGVNDTWGPEASPITDTRDKYERGKEILAELAGTPVPEGRATAGYAGFSPEIETFLKEHLFADIFERDVLTYAQREMVTVSVLIAIGGVEPMMRSHMNLSLNVGITPEQLKEMIYVIEQNVSKKEADAAKPVLTELLKSSAQTNTKNPFGLVYENAIRENIPGKVNIHPVTYKLNGIDIAANVYTPAGYDSSKKYPALVVAHPNGGIKEQVAGLYAQRLAEAGYITIAADAAYQGASGGEPRHTDNPAYRTEDIHGVADYITQYPGVDANRLGILGICGGGGYTLKATQSDKRFKAVATLSMFNSGEVRRNGFQNTQLATIQERLQQATDARAQEAAGGKTVYAGVPSVTDEEIANTPTDLYREGYEYYYRTHAHPNSTFLYTMSSLLDLMTWDATTYMDLLNQPLLMIAGSKADTKYMTDEAFAKAINAKSKELFLIDGATHIQTYWKQEYVDQIVNKLVDFFGGNLTSGSNKPVQISSAIQQSTGIFPIGEEINNNNFSGRAWHQRLVTDKENFDVTVGNVIFEPGVRNSWHSHPGGQILLCTSGKGYYQERGKPIQTLNVGDVVEILPDVVHWHGAAPDSGFEHIAIGTQTKKGEAVWYEPVTDDEYK